MIDKKIVAGLLDDALKSIGFNRSGLTWRRTSDDIITVVSIQSSEYDEAIYLNIGFWIRSLGRDIKSPKEHECHVRGRAEDVLPPREPDIQDLMFPETTMTDEARAQELADIINTHLVPLLRDQSTVLGLRQLAKERPRLEVYAVAKSALNIGD